MLCLLKIEHKINNEKYKLSNESKILCKLVKYPMVWNIPFKDRLFTILQFYDSKLNWPLRYKYIDRLSSRSKFTCKSSNRLKCVFFSGEVLNSTLVPWYFLFKSSKMIYKTHLWVTVFPGSSSSSSSTLVCYANLAIILQRRK